MLLGARIVVLEIFKHFLFYLCFPKKNFKIYSLFLYFLFLNNYLGYSL